MSEMEKRPYETKAHANDGYVTKDDPLILFRGALDYAEAEVLLTETMVDTRVQVVDTVALFRHYKELLSNLEELLDLLRKVMTAEYTGEPLEGIEPDGSGGTFRLFGFTLDELQEQSHNAGEVFGIPTMTRPDHDFGEVYCRLNLIRTELRQVESAAVRLFREEAATSGYKEPVRQDILYVLNRLSSAAHVLMCRQLAAMKQTGLLKD